MKLLDPDLLVVGVLLDLSVTIAQAAGECIIRRMPAGGPPRTLPGNLGNAVLDPNTCQTDPPPNTLRRVGSPS